jgi:flagellar protein FliJ
MVMTGPSFRFRLERVRALRERTEDQAKQAFAGAMQERVRSEREVKVAAERIAKAREAQLTLTSAPTSATELLARQAYLERSERAHRASQEDLGRRDLLLEQRREQLTDAARDRQTLERLKERRREEHQQEQLRIEAVTLDEIALNGFRRRTAA